MWNVDSDEERRLIERLRKAIHGAMPASTSGPSRSRRVAKKKKLLADWQSDLTYMDLMKSSDSRTVRLFAAEAAYAESIFRDAIGDRAASLTALHEALRLKPDYAPAILSIGSIEYQRKRRARGRRLFFSLLALPEDTKDLSEIIDKAGSFLIDIEEYADALQLFREGASKFPKVAEFQEGIGCCAGHEGFIDEALAAGRRAIELDPHNSAYVSDLGWTLLLAERYQEAEATLLRATAMNPSNERARANLEYCRDQMAKRSVRQNKKASVSSSFTKMIPME